MSSSIAQLDAWLSGLGAWAYLGLGAFALLEYLVPPVPGDAVTLLGGTLAARGGATLGGVYAALLLGSMAGLSAMYEAGRRFLPLIERLSLGVLSPESLARAQAGMRRHSVLLLLFNRFLPSFRAILFVAAGAAGVPFARVFFLGTLSAALWNGALLALGVLVGENLETVLAWISRYQRGLLLVVGAVAVLAWLRFWRGRKKRTSE